MRQFDLWYLLVGKTVCLATSDAREVYVSQMAVTLATAHAVLALATAVVYLMEHLMLCEEPEGAEYAATIHVWHTLFDVLQREGFGESAHGAPQQQAN